MIYQDDHSSKWYKRTRVIKILLFSAVLLIGIIVTAIASRPEKINDLSGGIYSATFRTTHKPLQRELLLLHKEGVFNNSAAENLIPDEFLSWYSAEETSQIINGRDIIPDAYRGVIRDCLQNCLNRSLHFVNPLENPVPGDLFRTLVWCFEYDLAKGDYKNGAEILENMFCFSSILLRSNAADIYFVSKSLECARQYEQTFGNNAEALDFWSKKRVALSGKYLFLADGLYRIERLRCLRDFEMVRLHGVRIYDGKITGSSQVKEGLGNWSLSLIKDGIVTSITDFFYDVDRDQTMTLVMLRKLLHEGVTPYMLEYPDRKISIQSYRRLSHQADVLASVHEYLGKRVE